MTELLEILHFLYCHTFVTHALQIPMHNMYIKHDPNNRKKNDILNTFHFIWDSTFHDICRKFKIMSSKQV